MLFSNGYDITVIEEEQVALAGSMQATINSPLFTSTLVVLLLMVCIAVALVYFVQCRQLQIRIAELNDQVSIRRSSYKKWSISSLKDEQKRLENAITFDLIKFD